MANNVSMASNGANQHAQVEGEELVMHFDSILNSFKYSLQLKKTIAVFGLLLPIVLRSFSREDLSLSLGFYNSENYPSLVTFTAKATRQLRNNREHALFGKMLFQRWRTS